MTKEMFEKFKMALDQLGFTRTVYRKWINPAKGDGGFHDESPEGLYPGIIVPTHHLTRRLFIIDYNAFERMFERIYEEFDSEFTPKGE